MREGLRLKYPIFMLIHGSEETPSFMMS